jgi:tRNA threonylcarbamoyladenosine biosynthesis protein TsaB
MLILGVDTSGKNGSVALARFNEQNAQTLELVPLEGGAFSAQLVPQISNLLARHNLSKRDLDGFAAVSGPGSFTGLRVGLAAIKALAEILQKPIAPVSLLEAVARKSGRAGEVIAAIDAGRSEVYVADCSTGEDSADIRNQRLLSSEEFAAFCGTREIVTPDAKIVSFARDNNLRVTTIAYPRADFIAQIGFQRIQRGETVSALDLDANYIRRSDAEIKKPALSSS